tara:strand:- start:51 stop:239 length:189 start_codon:yes stop_codon:yes gene_type:complete
MQETDNLEALINRHQDLDDKIDEMNEIRYLSSKERVMLKEFKMLRLQLKRMITNARQLDACN